MFLQIENIFLGTYKDYLDKTFFHHQVLNTGEKKI